MSDRKSASGRFPRRRGVGAFFKDERGIISVMAAFSIFLAIAVAVVVIDAGSLLLARRSLQSATDAAALAAADAMARYPSDASRYQNAVDDTLTANGYTVTDDLVSVDPGTYTADEAVSSGSRFAAAANTSDPSINAVRVTTKKTVGTYFARVLGLGNFNTVNVQATATESPMATFEAGTRLASLDNGLVNQVLGGLLGTTLSLSLVDYQSLANTQVDALSFLDALATEIGLTAGSTYSDLLSATVTVGQIIDASTSVLQTSGAASGSVSGSISALQQLANQAPTGNSFTLGDLLEAPSIAGRTIGGISSSLGSGAELDLYGLISATARLSGPGQLLNLTSGVTIPITGSSLQVKLAVGTAKQIATGPVGTSINTAQTRLAIDLKLANISLSVAGLGTLVATSIDLPIYLEAASGTATLKAVPCQTDDMVTLTGQTGAVTLKYGSVATSDLTNFTSSPTVSPAVISSVKLGSLLVAQITATGSAIVAGSSSEDRDFSQDDIDNRTTQSVPNSGITLIATNGPGALSTSIALLPGVNLGLLQSLLNAALSPLLTLVTNQLISALSLLDTPVNNVLTTLGLQLGMMDMDVVNAQCGVPVLVN